jgi:hypothetical protein
LLPPRLPKAGNDIHTKSLRVNLFSTADVAVRADHPANDRVAATRHHNFLRRSLSWGDYGTNLTLPKMIGGKSLFLACPARQSCAAL